MLFRASLVLGVSVGLFVIAGCADGNTPMHHADTGLSMDASHGTLDASRDGSADATVDAPDAPRSDAGHGLAGQCEACTVDSDCQSNFYCANLSGAHACFEVCNFDMPSCPAGGFHCVMDFSATPAPVCAPVGSTCCVDADGDHYGTGVGCTGADCNDDATTGAGIHPGAPELCDGIDQDCNGTVDDGDTAMLCPHGTHVASTMCTAGACTIHDCEPSFADCNTTASDGCETSTETATDCGGCGMACTLPHSSAPSCAHGLCVIGTCDSGFGDCDGNAANGCETPLDTATHCGTCSGTCGLSNAASTCATGTCLVDTCNRNWGDCDGRPSNGCETPLVTNTDCGMCGTVCAPATGTGTCSTGSCRVTTCAAGYDDCDLMSSNGCETSIRTLTNCGACGVPCNFSNGTASCSAGACTLVDCVPGFGNCDGITSNGCETHTVSLTSCGGCGVICAPANATGDCSAGACTILACNAGFADCDGIVANGCETSTRTLTDCGACHASCTRAGALSDCSTGMCRIASCLAGYGDCDMVDANGCETSTRTLSDCTGCGIACMRTAASASCASGMCAISTCNTGFANCDGADMNGCETSLASLGSCGSCGSVCARANATAMCSAGGVCTIAACNADWGNCDGVDANGCETPLTTLTNCGTCGSACSRAHASATCSTGACEIAACASGFGDCDGTDSNGCETSLRTLTDCSACGLDCSFPNATASCASGTCALGACTAGFGNCDGNVANGCEAPLTTLTNCGACATPCSFTNGAASCTTGTCTLGVCSSGFGNCDMMSSNGCETSLHTLTDCASCGTACSFANAGASCSTGACTLGSCSSGFADCDAMSSNGCETSLHTLTDCASCGTACSLPHAVSSCASGSCNLSSCASGFGNCDGSPGNGCETQLNSLANCGGCGTACNLPNATSSCGTGTCAIVSCTAGFANCDGMVANGCETSTHTLTNCGSCGSVCTVMSGTPTCATGTCQVSSCGAGFADCDGNSGNGCETSTHTLTNCGSCGTACMLSNATATCSTGTCAISTCNPGYGDCDANPANGCETQLNSIVNCGMCGMTCMLANASTSCAGGTCMVSGCTPGFGNCNGLTGDGCETQLNTLTNCATCGTACSLNHATATCGSGTCAIASCTAGFGNCDGVASNGCETPLNTLGNCGGCGVGCSRAGAIATCASGSCAISSCNSLLGNCDAIDSNGCETPLTTLTNCGMCGMSCAPAHATGTCSTGTCAVGSCSPATTYFDVNMSVSDGCECMDDPASATCPGGNIGNVAQGATLTQSGLIPAVGGTDWYSATFTTTGVGTPTIAFSSNPGTVFHFDVYVGTCSTGSVCSGAEVPTGLTTWNWNNSFNGSTQSDPWPATVYIRVTRTGSSQSCVGYTLQLTRP